MSDYEPQPSGWAIGGVTFAATMLVVIGIFQIIAGLAAIFDDQFYVVTQNYAFDLDVSAWGWIHLIIGILLVVTGYFLFGAVVTWLHRFRFGASRMGWHARRDSNPRPVD